MPIVVEDKIGQDPKKAAPQDEQTAVVAGKPEPGRDIFAGDPAKDIQSQASHALKVEKDPNSLILSETSTEVNEKAKHIGTSASSDSQSSSNLNSEPVQTLDSVRMGEGTTTSSRQVEDDSVIHKPVGPLPEAEAEANRAAHELFPDAVKQK